LVLLVAWGATTPLLAGGFITTVNAPAKLMDGERVMTEIPRGTKIWIFDSKPGWVEVKEPQGERHGWIRSQLIEKLDLSEANNKLLGEATELTKRAYQAQRADQLVESRKLFEESYQTLRRVWGDDHPHTALTAVDLAIALFPVPKEDARVRTLLADALTVSERWLGKNHEQTLNTMISLADYHLMLANYTEAEKWLTWTILRCADSQGKNSPQLASYLIRLGTLYRAQGDNPRARAIWQEALNIYERNPQASRQNVALIQNRLGNLASAQGDQVGAIRHFSAALRINRELFGLDSSSYAQTLVNIGVAHGESGKFELAKQYYEHALGINARVHGADSDAVAGVKHNLGLLAAYQRDFATALKYYNEALPLYKRNLGSKHPHVAALLNCIANVVRDQGDYQAARQLYEEALAIERQAYGPQHHEVGGTLRNLAFLAFQEGDDPRALRDWHESRLLENRRVRTSLPALSPAEQLHYLNSAYRRDWFHALSFGYLRRERQEIVDRSAEWLLNGKAIAQESLAEQQRAVQDDWQGDRKQIGAELQEIRNRLAKLANTQPAANARAAHRAEVDRLTAEEQRLSILLAGPLREPQQDVVWHELAELRRLLKPDSVYIDLVRMPLSDLAGLRCDFAVRPAGPANYFAWIIPPAGQGEVRILDLGPADKIDALVEQVRAELAVASKILREQGEATAAAKLQQPLRETGKLVLRPLLPALEGKRQLILSPDGGLWLLPWAALPVNDEQSLLERCSLRYALSGRDAAKDEPTGVYITSAPAIFANPDFDLSSAAAQAVLQQNSPSLSEELARRGDDSHSGLPRVKELPFTEFEGQAAKLLLAKLPRTKEPRFYARAEALEEYAKQLERPQHLLFATHGFFLQDPPPPEDADNVVVIEEESPVVTNPLLRCGLLLAGCNSRRSGGLDDGILTGLEIVGMDLRGTELVVLSACETGIGKVRNGEGVAGLRQAFQLAGAESVVSTLWQVPDRDSAIIMQDFFTNLATGQTKADALRNAQLKRIAARKEKSGAAHPFFWAAWTVTGE